MHYHSVKPELLAALRKLMLLPSLKDFILVGGTNLTLQRGHRMSIDIDLFSDKDRYLINNKDISHEIKSVSNNKC